METSPSPSPNRPLRRGWTTGACAAAAARAAARTLWAGHCPASVAITLPSGAQPEFAVATQHQGEGYASAGIVKDAGDDPDVTHGALILVTVRQASPGTGIAFRAGPGVGIVTKPGLVLPPGEPAINPVPRQMVERAVVEAATTCGVSPDLIVEISIPGGEALAQKTLNPRLGIIGGLSILGTTGIVVPFSCAAWIHSIHRGIDVARALGLKHIAGSTGATSEAAVARLYELSENALIDMGDFVGGMLKYLNTHRVPRVTIAGGVAKMTKLAQGRLDLHSRRGGIDFNRLGRWLTDIGAAPELLARAHAPNSALEVFEMTHAAGLDLPDLVAGKALRTVLGIVAGSGMHIDVAVFDRQGGLLARTDPVRA
jgi:cobalt-precorrin-5B (C1)-methyltransferase